MVKQNKTSQILISQYKRELFLGLVSAVVGIYMLLVFFNMHTAINIQGNDIPILSWLTFYTFQVNCAFALYAIIFGATRFISYDSPLRANKFIKNITHNNVQIAFVIWLGISYVVSIGYSSPPYRGMFVVFQDDVFFFHNFSFIFSIFLYFLVRGSAKSKLKWLPLIMAYPAVYAIIATVVGTNYDNKIDIVNGVSSGWVDMFNPENFDGQVWPICVLATVIFVIFSFLTFALARLKDWLDTNYYLLGVDM